MKSTSQSPSAALKRLMRDGTELVRAGLMLGLVVVALIAMSEHAGRQQFAVQMVGQIEEAKTGLIEEQRQLASEAGSDEEASEARLDEPRPTSADLISSLSSIHSDALSLIAAGADRPEQTLAYLRERRRSPFSFPNPDRISRGMFFRALDGYFGFPSYLSADWLLAIIVIACGAIGTIIAGLRADKALTFRDLTLGLASGFVTFLALKGGRQVFLLQMGDTSTVFNPYSCAFAGLLVGLFSQRAYRFLSALVDQFTSRAEAVVKGDASPPR